MTTKTQRRNVKNDLFSGFTNVSSEETGACIGSSASQADVNNASASDSFDLSSNALANNEKESIPCSFVDGGTRDHGDDEGIQADDQVESSDLVEDNLANCEDNGNVLCFSLTNKFTNLRHGS